MSNLQIMPALRQSVIIKKPHYYEHCLQNIVKNFRFLIILFGQLSYFNFIEMIYSLLIQCHNKKIKLYKWFKLFS
jgi:hypothetical protein